MRNLLILMLFVTGLNSMAQNEHQGISFFQGSFDQAIAAARSENKLVFIDFYTQWCGPCKIMDEEVYPEARVGNFYNEHFISLKIDAEHGEGVELAKRFKVGSYPSFSFIDPQTANSVHDSGSRQDADVFLFTGKSAITPNLRSVYLEENYKNGNVQPEFLYDYLRYLASRYQQNKINEVVKLLTAQEGFSIKTEDGWALFENYINGYSNPYFNELLSEKDKFVEIFGQKRVDAKLWKEFNYCREVELIKAAPEFAGKEFLYRKNVVQKYINEKAYEEAARNIEVLIDSTTEFKDELCRFLNFTSRIASNRESTPFWDLQCLKYAQYVAYNNPDRKDFRVHYDYANLLENIIRKMPDAAKYFPSEIADKPSKGKTEYTLRADSLKAKPKPQTK